MKILLLLLVIFHMYDIQLLVFLGVLTLIFLFLYLHISLIFLILFYTITFWSKDSLSCWPANLLLLSLYYIYFYLFLYSLQLLKYFTACLPIHSPIGTATAFPICLYASLSVPENSNQSGNPCSLPYSLTV